MSRDIRAQLRGVIPEDSIKHVTRSFDVIGSREKAVAIIEIPEEVSQYESEIGEALMRVQKNIKSVLAKSGVSVNGEKVEEKPEPEEEKTEEKKEEEPEKEEDQGA